MPAPAGRMPAEWEPHTQTWLAWPHNADTWIDCLDDAQREFEGLVRAIAGFEPVRVLARSTEHRQEIERRLEDPETTHPIAVEIVPTDDAWLRDTGPTFVQAEDGSLRAIDWIFNAWGGKYAPWDRDARVAAQIAKLAGVEHQPSRLTLEGGALEVDGEGTLLATRSSVLDADRNPELGEAEVEEELRTCLGVRRTVWLEGSLSGDDTDGHIDNLVRFVAPARVVCAMAGAPAHPDRESLLALRATLEAARDAKGRPLEVIELPLPTTLEHHGAPLPASYANFLIVNGGVIVPVFHVDDDARALEILRKCFPSRRLAPVPCATLVRGFGGPHCLSQQQPRPRDA